MRKLNSIQKVETLNNVFAFDETSNDGINYRYVIFRSDDNPDKIGEHEALADIKFQNGSRNNPESVDGVCDTDLLEIVRDRLKGLPFSYGCENAHALRHIEEAIMWLNCR